MRPFANRLRLLGTETAFDVLAHAKALEAQGLKIIHLEIGEPDFDTPRLHPRSARSTTGTHITLPLQG